MSTRITVVVETDLFTQSHCGDVQLFPVPVSSGVKSLRFTLRYGLSSGMLSALMGVILQEMNASELLVGPNDADSLLSRFPLPLRTADD